MKVFYALWVTRNGQHLWAGPFRTRTEAADQLAHLMYCTGQRITEGVEN